MTGIMKYMACLTILLACAGTAQSQSVGLVLSGGGAKGIAHIGVIQALEDNDIPIDYITGTSMGSIVGGLYAAGYSPAEMMTLIESKGFANWSTGTIDESYVNYFASPQPSPAMISISLDRNDSTTQVLTPLSRGSLINPLPMNFAFMELFAPYTAQCGGNFNNLFVPFRCVASNVYAKHKVVFSSGSLGDAIRASMSFPFVFKPITFNGVPLYDGGIYDNFPIDVMQSDFAPSFTIGIDVSTDSETPTDGNMLSEIEAMIMQPQDYSVPAKSGVKIHIHLQEFSLLDFAKCREIYKIGYDKAMEYMDSIKSRLPRREARQNVELRRNVFKSATPELIFGSVAVDGSAPNQNRYVKFLFESREKGDTLTLENARIAFYNTVSTGKIQNLLPKAKYNPDSRLFDLDLDLSSKHRYSLGAGGFITSSTNSMIFLNAGYSTLSFHSFDANVSGWIGQSYYALQGEAKLSLHTRIPSELGFEGVISRNKFYESDILFYKDNSPSFILKYDYFGRVRYSVELGSKAKFTTGVGYGYLRDRFYNSSEVNFAEVDQNETRYRLAQLYFRADGNTLNSINYPTRGYKWEAAAMGVTGDYKYMPESRDINPYESLHWLQLKLSGEKYWNLTSHFTLGGKAEVLASTKKLLNNYTASIVQAPEYAPTPATQNYFNTAFRANSYIAAGVIPIYTIMQNLQLRGELHAFVPMRRIEESSARIPEYGKWFSHAEWLGEAALVYSFPFASLSIYGNYLSYPKRNWNFGISFGILLPANKFL